MVKLYLLASHWLHVKFEVLVAIIVSITTAWTLEWISADYFNVAVKIAVTFFAGVSGAAGAHAWKWSLQKYKDWRKKNKAFNKNKNNT